MERDLTKLSEEGKGILYKNCRSDLNISDYGRIMKEAKVVGMEPDAVMDFMFRCVQIGAALGYRIAKKKERVRKARTV